MIGIRRDDLWLTDSTRDDFLDVRSGCSEAEVIGASFGATYKGLYIHNDVFSSLGRHFGADQGEKRGG